MIDLLAGFCVLIALGAALVAGVFTGRRRAAEARLSLVGGEPRPLFLARAGIEAAPARRRRRRGRFRDSPSSWSGSSRRRARWTEASSGKQVPGSARVSSPRCWRSPSATTLARGRIGGGSTALSTVARIPWEGVAIAGSGRVVARPGPPAAASSETRSQDRIRVSSSSCCLRSSQRLSPGSRDGSFGLLVLRRRRRSRRLRCFLALRRVAAARGLVVALTVTVVGRHRLVCLRRPSFGRRWSRTAPRRRSSRTAPTSRVSSTRHASIPRSFPYPVTKVSEIFDAGTLPSGQSFEALIVDPASLGRVLAAHWPPDVRSAVRKLASSERSTAGRRGGRRHRAADRHTRRLADRRPGGRAGARVPRHAARPSRCS